MLTRYRFLSLLFFLFIFLGIGNFSIAQQSGKSYYLLTNISLSEYSADDKATIKRAMEKYHSAKHDSDRLNAIEIITENLMHDVFF